MQMTLIPDRASLMTSSAHWSADLPLPPRGCEALRLVASGLTNKEIAAVLYISEWTIPTHMRRKFGKLDVHSNVAMVRRVLGIVAAAERRSHESLNWTRSGFFGS
ncbi:helix-turn-helix transcriptional regulator [Ruegeria sp. Ofav3-42]|uniref:helix-turn-helix domain-containing protein n=1 Tax=Ruegeria sp. Ofav3-42 TaxID=2917759 RepID=UPI001EF462FA|nr:LuxR C-terminal-related transcriptional regulator [Ruegeria sp. Ofav3-42]MCG7521480.1 LuxR C-terminal-related transcriptional regulator [Ruegeria sp. Ofav3-42]